MLLPTRKPVRSFIYISISFIESYNDINNDNDLLRNYFYVLQSFNPYHKYMLTSSTWVVARKSPTGDNAKLVAGDSTKKQSRSLWKEQKKIKNKNKSKTKHRLKTVLRRWNFRKGLKTMLADELGLS